MSLDSAEPKNASNQTISNLNNEPKQALTFLMNNLYDSASRDGTKSEPTSTRVAPFSSLFASKLNTQALLSGGFPTPSVLARGRVELQRVKKLRQTMNALT